VFFERSANAENARKIFVIAAKIIYEQPAIPRINDRMDNPNVQRKQSATVEWYEKINTLHAGKRMERK